jgi:hypothetical protein
LKAGCAGYTRALQLKSEAAPTGAPAPARPDSTLFGLSNQVQAGIRMPVALRVAKNGHFYASWAVALKCGRSTFWWLNATPSTKVKPDGTFSRSEHFVISYSDGTSESYRVRFAGRFLADGAVGTLRATEQYHDKGVRYKTCRSGAQTWSARP